MAVNGLYYTDVPLSNYSLTHFSAVRQRYFRVDTLKELFEIVDSRNIAYSLTQELDAVQYPKQKCTTTPLRVASCHSSFYCQCQPCWISWRSPAATDHSGHTGSQISPDSNYSRWSSRPTRSGMMQIHLHPQGMFCKLHSLQCRYHLCFFHNYHLQYVTQNHHLKLSPSLGNQQCALKLLQHFYKVFSPYSENIPRIDNR